MCQILPEDQLLDLEPGTSFVTETPAVQGAV